MLRSNCFLAWRTARHLLLASALLLSANWCIPSHLAVAQAIDLLEADGGSNNIYAFAPNGTRSTFALGFDPAGLAFNSSGNLFVGDYNQTYRNPGTIYEFTPSGGSSTFATGLSGPQGLALDSSGNLFEGDSGSGTIYEFTPGGIQSTFASGFGGIYYGPYALAFNSSGDLFSPNGGSIYEFTPGGNKSVFASGLPFTGAGPYPNVDGLAFNSVGDLFASDWTSGDIYEFTPNGTQSTFASGLSYPNSLAFDSSGNLFVTGGGYSSGAGYIDEFTPNGTQSTFATGLNDPGYLAFGAIPTPEPSTFALLCVGAIGLLGYAWRRRKAAWS